MKKFVFGTIVGVVVGVLVQDKCDAKNIVMEKAGEAYYWIKKKINDLTKDAKEEVEDIQESTED